MTVLGKDSRRRKIRLKLAGDTAPPALGHQTCRSHRLEVAHAAQSIFAAAVYYTLRPDCLTAAESVRFEKDCVVAGAAQTVEAPKSGSAAAEHEHI